MAVHTWGEIDSLLQKADAGDKSAKEQLDQIAHEEGYQDWESYNEDLSEQFSPIIQEFIEAFKEYRQRIDADPEISMLMGRLKQLYKNSPVDAAIISQIPVAPFHHLEKMKADLRKALQNLPIPAVIEPIVPNTISLNHTTGPLQPGYIAQNEFEGRTIQALNANTEQLLHPPKAEPRTDIETITVVSDRAKSLDRLAFLWVDYNTTKRQSKKEGMEWFIGEYAPEVGLDYLPITEFKSHLGKLLKAGKLSKDKGRYHRKIDDSK